MTDPRLEARVSVLEERVDAIDEEVQRARDRLHKVESTNYAVRQLTREFIRLRRAVPELATTAAEKAIELDRERTSERRRAGMSLRQQRVSIFIAAGGTLYAILEQAGVL
jgi:hypothetical protein